MNTKTTTTNSAEAFVEMINDMAQARRDYAAANGFTATDAEIADSIKASLVRMASAR